MIEDISYGVVPFRKIEGKWCVLLVQHAKARYWGFPKGHPEEGEGPLDAAKRELFEETNQTVIRLFSETPFEEHYKFTWKRKLISKTVFYFAAEVKGDLLLQKHEVRDGRWIPEEEVSKILTYATDRSVFDQARQLL